MSRKSPHNFVPPKQTLLDWIRAVELQKAEENVLRQASGKPLANAFGQMQLLSASPPPKKTPTAFNRPKMRCLEISKDCP